MKCIKCKRENIIKAQYCQYCGHNFTNNERETAYHKTIFYKLEAIEKWYKHLTLKTITDSLPFKIISVLLVLVLGIYYVFTTGINVKILNNDSYEIFCNDKLKEYYLVVSNELNEVPLSLYVPNRTNNIEVLHYDSDKLLDEITYEKNDNIILDINDTDYYLLKTNYDKDKSDKLKISVYRASDVEIKK